MSESNHEKINSLLNRCQTGDQQARDQLFKLLYPELKRIATYKLYQQTNNITAQATEIVNELYIKFATANQFPAKNRLYFFAIAATAIEQIIVDFARRKNALRRGGDWQRVNYDEHLSPTHETLNLELLQLGQLLHELKQIDALAASIFSIKLFTDMQIPDISIALDVSERTIGRKWAFAKSYIHHNMQEAQ